MKEQKKINEMNSLELKGVLFDLREQYEAQTRQLVELINKKLQEENDLLEEKEDGTNKE